MAVNLTELVTSTLRDRSSEIADNVTNHNALAKRITEKGNRKPAVGRTIVEPLDYADNATVQMYSGFDTLDTSPAEHLDAAEFDWKQMAGTVVMNGLERIQNSGKAAAIDWIEARLKNLERSLDNELAQQVYKDGSVSTDFDGLQNIVADTGSSTVGGISSATYSWWANAIYDYSANSATPGSTTVQTAMNALYLSVIRGTDAPDFWVADSTYFTHYWSSLTSIQRITSDDSASAGFRSLSYLGADFFYDDQCPANHIYALNTDYLKLRYSEQEWFTPGEPRIPFNQNSFIIPVFVAGNLCVSNRARQGVIVA